MEIASAITTASSAYPIVQCQLAGILPERVSCHPFPGSFIYPVIYRISRSSSMISASVFSSINKEISSIRLSAKALFGTIAAKPITMISARDAFGVMYVLLIHLRCRNIVLILQLCDEAFYNHAFLFQAMNPFGPQSEGHYSYSHILFTEEAYKSIFGLFLSGVRIIAELIPITVCNIILHSFPLSNGDHYIRALIAAAHSFTKYRTL